MVKLLPWMRKLPFLQLIMKLLSFMFPCIAYLGGFSFEKTNNVALTKVMFTPSGRGVTRT